MRHTARLLWRLLRDALGPPRPVCPECARHILIARELSARLAETLLDGPPPARSGTLGSPLFSVAETPGPPEWPGTPVLPPPVQDGWGTIYPAGDDRGNVEVPS
jgi:hypothetical protein